MNNYYFIVKENENQMEILGGADNYAEAYETYTNLVAKWQGPTSTFLLVSCPIVMTAKVHEKTNEQPT